MLIWVETPAGEFVSCETHISTALGDVVMRGRPVRDQLEMTTTAAGKHQTVRLEWRKEWGGFFAVEQSLQRQPMQPNQRRSLRALLPMFNVVADIDMEAVGYEQTALLTTTRELLKIRTTTRLPDGNKLETIMWTDREGCPRKTVMPGVGQETYVTTRETALDDSGYAGLDLGHDMVVKIDRPWDSPHATRRAVYRVQLAREDPAKVFASGLNQQVQSLDPHRALVTVQAIRPDQPAQTNGHLAQPGPADLRANSLIQSDDQQVVAMAQSVAPQEKDPWRLAQLLEEAVGEAIEAKDFSQAFATAAEVVQTRQGDCTEHAVLLAALCRARQIPARVSIGLVYASAEQGFAYHMWNEVWIRDRWIPLDATLGQGGIGAAHIKLADSDLDGAGAYSTFLPVLHVMGQLKLEIVEVQ